MFEVQGVIYTDAKDGGLVEIGVDNEGRARAVEAKLKQLGIPLSSVEIVVTKPIVNLQTLRDRVRPLQGGLEITFIDGPFLSTCTLGFNATRSGVGGYVTNSHCTADEGKVDGTKYYQPTLATANLIGTEVADPRYFKGGDCPKSWKCRYSDSAFADREDGVAADLGSIARTTGPGSLIIDGSFNIVGEAPGNAAEETILSKVGRTTGWTQGEVINSCMDVGVIGGGNKLLICQDRVAAGSDGGDSGSPVFGPLDASNNVTLYGILWGGAIDGSTFTYSPIANPESTEGRPWGQPLKKPAGAALNLG